MTDRAQWILFFSIMGCGLTTIVIGLLLLLHKRHKPHQPPGDATRVDLRPITTAIDGVKTDIHDSRVETAVASEGIRQQMDSNQVTNEMDAEHSNAKLNWIKAMIVRWFALVKPPGDPPSDEKKP